MLGWVLSSAGALLLAAVLSVFARAMPAAGGPYAYTRAAFGPATAFIVVWGYWISIWTANAAIATAATSYISTMLPQLFAVRGVSTLFTLFLIWFFTLVNWWGVTAVGWIQSVTTVLKLLPLIAIALLGFFHTTHAGVVAASNAPLSLGGTTAAVSLCFYALLGFESATVPDGKVRDPARTIPRATLIGAIVTTVLYTLSSTVVMLLVPPADARELECTLCRCRAVPVGPGGQQLRDRLCRHQLRGLPERLDAAAGRGAGGHGAERGLPAHLRADVAAQYPDVRAGHHERARQPARAHHRLQLPGERVHVHDPALDHRVRGHVRGVRGGDAAAEFPGPARAAMNRSGAKLLVLGVLAVIFSVWAIYGAGTEAVLWGAALLAAGIPVYWLVRLRGARAVAPVDGAA